MAISEQMTIQRVYEILVKDTITGKILAYLTDLKTSGLENTQELFYPTGGDGNVYVGSAIGHSKRAMIDVTSATYNTTILASQVGKDIVVGANTNYIHYETLTVNSDAASTTLTALGTAGAEIGNIQQIDSTGSVLQEFTQVAGVPTTGQFQYTSGTKTLDFFAGDLTDGSTIRLTYRATTGATAKYIEVEANTTPKLVDIVAYGVVTNPCDGSLFKMQLKARAQISGTWSFDLAADGEVSSQPFSLEFVKQCGSNRLYDILIYTEEDLT